MPGSSYPGGLQPEAHLFVPDDLSDPASLIAGGIEIYPEERTELQGLLLPVHAFGVNSKQEIDLVDIRIMDLIATLRKEGKEDIAMFFAGVERVFTSRKGLLRNNPVVGFLPECGHLEKARRPRPQ